MVSLHERANFLYNQAMQHATNSLTHVPFWHANPAPVDPWLADAVAALSLDGLRYLLRDFKHATMEAGWTSGIHRHHYSEVDLLLVGSGETSSVPVQRLSPGHILLHGPGVPHAWQAPAGHACDVLSIGFTTEPEIALALPARWPCSPELVTEAQLLVDDMQREAPGWRDRLPLRIGIILSRALALLTRGSSDAGQSLGTDRMAALDRFLREHLAAPLTLDEIADHLCVSRRTLTRLLREQTGSTVMERLRTFRLVHAAELLWQTDLPLATIAERVGIAQPAYFCRCFLRHFTCTPIHYRRQLRAAHHEVSG